MWCQLHPPAILPLLSHIVIWITLQPLSWISKVLQENINNSQDGIRKECWEESQKREQKKQRIRKNLKMHNLEDKLIENKIW